MSIGWSSEAQAAILAGCPMKWTFHIDVEQNGTGLYGVNIVDITDYVLPPLPKIKRNTPIIEKNWKISPIVVKVRNDTAYFTPNLCGVSKTQVQNIWKMRPSGEAKAEECKLYIKQVITLPNGSTETKTRFKGMIKELNPFFDEKNIVCEITVRDEFFDALDRIFEIGDGGTDTAIQSYPV